MDNLVRLETRNAGPDGSGAITIRDLIKSALRMRPDRIVVGEVRGAEALDISTDITVLENMMAREGLVDSPLKAEPDEKKETDIRLEQ